MSKKVTKKTQVGTIDLTPRWIDVLPMLIDAITTQGVGRPKYEVAVAELMNMAIMADKSVELARAVQLSLNMPLVPRS